MLLCEFLGEPNLASYTRPSSSTRRMSARSSCTPRRPRRTTSRPQWIHITQPLPRDVLIFFTGQDEIESALVTLQHRTRGFGTNIPI